MSGIGHRIRRDLEQIAERATPSADAWVQIQHRIESTGEDQQMEVVMIETDQHRTQRRRPFLWAAAAALILVVVGVTVTALNDGSDDQVGVAGEPERSAVDTAVEITVDGQRYVLAPPELCYQGVPDPGDPGPLVHVIGRTVQGTRVELSFHYDPDPPDPSDPPGYRGVLSIHEGATAYRWRAEVTSEPWPYLEIRSTSVTGEVPMTEASGEVADVTVDVACAS